ncbi:hypothetical protein KUTeg_009884 [Tegillarca granosa]|uniref:Uncharacterized protein n=1 Tax=Tegillarca granosa TaxID=220873 RepID=A0ABQ9F7G8_TEGGR|nr:hypothetical protein KUTeg_009884 [Tegillarca granosa]
MQQNEFTEKNNNESSTLEIFPQLNKKQKISFVRAKQNLEGKRVYDKRDECFYCQVMLTDLRKHLIAKHHQEIDVCKMMALPLASKERKDKLKLIRYKGNFFHNKQVLDSQKGTLLVVRRPSEKQEIDADNYGPCGFCLVVSDIDVSDEQVFGLKDAEIGEVARHMGHELSVHKEFYRLQDDVIELAKISKLLLAEYTENYNAVDKNDQLRSYSGIANKAKKWWKYLFWFLVDVTVLVKCSKMSLQKKIIVKLRLLQAEDSENIERALNKAIKSSLNEACKWIIAKKKMKSIFTQETGCKTFDEAKEKFPNFSGDINKHTVTAKKYVPKSFLEFCRRAVTTNDVIENEMEIEISCKDSDDESPVKRRRWKRILPIESDSESDCVYSSGDESSTLEIFPQLNKKQKISFVRAKQNLEGKRVYDKRDECFYCQVMLTDLRKHLIAKHHQEIDVCKMMALPLASKERKDKLKLIRYKGNFFHNKQVLDSQKGTLLVVRRPSEKQEIDADNYGPCDFCLGFFMKDDLY